MLLSLALQSLGDLPGVYRIHKLFVAPGSELRIGSKLLDVRLDLSAAAPQECAPISFFRLASREKAWLRHLAVAEGEICTVGQLLALFGSTAEEPLNGSPTRALRITTASILADAEWLPK